MDKIKVLHVTPDNKFFDPVIISWEKNEDVENKAVLITKDRNHQFKYIQATEKVEILWNSQMVKRRFSSDDYDVLFFHSLPSKIYKYFRYIPKSKIVIWWGWGFDIYYPTRGLPPLIKLDMFKPLTQDYVINKEKCFRKKLSNLRWSFLKPIYLRRRISALDRIDYYQPVVRCEYEMMKCVNHFRAKEFYYKPFNIPIKQVSCKRANGDILLGNSATPSNNHLDILQVVNAIKCKSQKIIMPLSYGDAKYTSWLLSSIDYSEIVPIVEFMPRDEYFRLIEGCSYAIFGVIRQQAMGNVSFAINHGVKVFLYRDSIVYKNQKELGYVVYAIEDMTEESLRTPLTPEEIKQNFHVYQKELARRLAVYDDCHTEMMSLIKEKGQVVNYDLSRMK